MMDYTGVSKVNAASARVRLTALAGVALGAVLCAGGAQAQTQAQSGEANSLDTNQVQGERAGALRVGVTVAPERGKANEAIADVLADALGCRPSQIVLLAGATARDKRFLVVGLDPDALRDRIAPLIAPEA